MAKKVKVIMQKRCRIAGKRAVLGKDYSLDKELADRLVGSGQAVFADNKEAVAAAKDLVEKIKKREALAVLAASDEDPEETQG